MDKKFLTSTVLAATCFALPAWAQNTPEGANTIGDIVVTARRAEESLQVTPVAVTALGAEELAEAQIVDFQDLQLSAPSLATSTGGPGGPGLIFVAIRGQVNVTANSLSDSAVGTYVDGVYIARPTSGNLGFLDAARVEVLRGPQGTLFGRNTTGGAINVVNVQPDGEQSGYIRAGAGNYDFRQVEGAATMPITGDELSLRVAGRYATRDGYYDNISTGEEVSDLNYAWGGRAILRWAPDNMPFELSLSADESGFDDSGQASVLVGVNEDFRVTPFVSIGQAFAAAGLDPDDYTYPNVPWDQTFGITTTGNSEIDTPNDDNHSRGFSATLDVDFNSWRLKSISAWRSTEARNSLDLDGTPFAFVDFASEYRQEQVSQELQATTTIGNLDLIGGLYYFREHGDERTNSRSLADYLPLVPLPPFFGLPVPIAQNYGIFESESQAVFAQANYHFTERLRGTLGYRYTWDTRSLDKRNIQNIALPPSAPNCAAAGSQFDPVAQECSLDLSQDLEYPAWTVGLDYEVNDDVFVYARSGRASISGGFNARLSPPGTDSYGPETLTDFEVGAKADWLDGRLRTNVALFHSETEDVQRLVTVFLNGRQSSFTTNAGDTETNGLELEITALPWEGMEVNFGAALLDASYVDGSFVDEVLAPQPPPAPPVAVARDRSGEPVPHSPDWVYTIGLTQDFELSVGRLTAHLDYFITADKPIDPNTASPTISPANAALGTQFSTIESYGLLNGSLALALENGATFTLWGRNLTDEEYATNTFNSYNVLGFAVQSQGDPRTYGVRLSYDF